MDQDRHSTAKDPVVDSLPWFVGGGLCLLTGVALMWDDVKDLADFWKERPDFFRPGQTTDQPLHHWLVGLILFFIGLVLVLLGLLTILAII